MVLVGVFLLVWLGMGALTGAAVNNTTSVPLNDTGTNTTIAGNETDSMNDTSVPSNTTRAENVSIADEPLGRVNGIWYNDSLNVTYNDGLSDEELGDVVSRSMARVEYIRGLKFQSMVNITVISRDRRRELTRTETMDYEFRQWNTQIWKALFIIGEDEDVADEFERVRSESVKGYYRIGTGNITMVARNPEAVDLDVETLVHELIHALQDQHYNLSSDQFQGVVQDRQLGRQGLIEGDSEYVRMQYVSRCEFEWECLPLQRQQGPDETVQELNLGLWGVLYQPYADGPAYVQAIVDRYGWEAVNNLYFSPPSTSRELIHQELFFEPRIRFNDTSTDGWQRYQEFGFDGADSVGEASVYMMFWYQSVEYGANVVDTAEFNNDPNPYSSYNYVSESSSGLIGDRLVPYRNARTGESGYVWVLEWESEDDVTEFAWDYFRILHAHEATVHEAGTWIIRDGGFSGAYRVSRDATTVTITHAPSIQSLDEIRPLPERNSSAGSVELSELPPPEIYSYSSRSTPEVEQPGFGLLAGVVAVFLGAVFLARRSVR